MVPFPCPVAEVPSSVVPAELGRQSSCSGASSASWCAGEEAVCSMRGLACCQFTTEENSDGRAPLVPDSCHFAAGFLEACYSHWT